ncbi:MAG TPA: hypothetical protein VM783_14115 [Candidatus Acidoferrum sp.]|nr:hypothetical protein [Candidatus Acidoferrum sp.]
MQEKLIFLLGGVVISLLACLGCYAYGHSIGEKVERASWEQREASRVSGTATAAIQHTGEVIAQVKQDNEIERKANEGYETAMAQLAVAQADNRRLVRINGGLRIDATACAGRDQAASSTQTTGTSVSPGSDPGTIALPEQIDADLQDSADEADIILERYRVLRSWCFDQGFCKLSTTEPAP